MSRMQRALSLLYPDQCVLCPELVDGPGALCPSCWRDMPFLRGLVCDGCGAPLTGGSVAERAFCDDCISARRPWDCGRAALGYRDSGRRLVLALKHGDRPDLAWPAAAWMQSAGAQVLRPGTLLVPVPVHWSRLIARRYNQAAELTRALGRRAGLDVLPDALWRQKRTRVQDGMTVHQRHENLEGAIAAHRTRGALLRGREVCLIDDVMTSGATLAASTAACHDAGASRVSVLVLARVMKAT